MKGTPLVEGCNRTDDFYGRDEPIGGRDKPCKGEAVAIGI